MVKFWNEIQKIVDEIEKKWRYIYYFKREMKEFLRKN